MENFNIQVVYSYVVSILAYLLGGLDSMLIALCVFMILDYVTGLLKAIKKHKLSSKVGFTGLAKKVFILIIVCVSAVIDKIIGVDGVVRTFVVVFYICNEGISILENATAFNVPFPQKLKDILEEVNKENEEKVNAKK